MKNSFHLSISGIFFSLLFLVSFETSEARAEKRLSCIVSDDALTDSDGDRMIVAAQNLTRMHNPAGNGFDHIYGIFITSNPTLDGGHQNSTLGILEGLVKNNLAPNVHLGIAPPGTACGNDPRDEYGRLIDIHFAKRVFRDGAVMTARQLVDKWMLEEVIPDPDVIPCIYSGGQQQITRAVIDGGPAGQNYLQVFQQRGGLVAGMVASVHHTNGCLGSVTPSMAQNVDSTIQGFGGLVPHGQRSWYDNSNKRSIDRHMRAGNHGWVDPNNLDPSWWWLWDIDIHGAFGIVAAGNFLREHGHLPVAQERIQLFPGPQYARTKVIPGWIDFTTGATASSNGTLRNLENIDLLSPLNYKRGVYKDVVFLPSPDPAEFDWAIFMQGFREMLALKSFHEDLGKDPMTGMQNFENVRIGWNQEIRPYYSRQGNYGIDSDAGSGQKYLTTNEYNEFVQALPLDLNEGGGGAFVGVSQKICPTNDWSRVTIDFSRNYRSTDDNGKTSVGLIQVAPASNDPLNRPRVKVVVFDEGVARSLSSQPFYVDIDSSTNRMEFDLFAKIYKNSANGVPIIKVFVDGILRHTFNWSESAVPLEDHFVHAFFRTTPNTNSGCQSAPGGNIFELNYFHTQNSQEVSVEQHSHDTMRIVYAGENAWQKLFTADDFVMTNGEWLTLEQFLLWVSLVPYTLDGNEHFVTFEFKADENAVPGLPAIVPSQSTFVYKRVQPEIGETIEDWEYVY